MPLISLSITKETYSQDSMRNPLTRRIQPKVIKSQVSYNYKSDFTLFLCHKVFYVVLFSISKYELKFCQKFF